MIEDFQEYYFLTDCYGIGISDEKIYQLFISKVLSNLNYPSSYRISQLQDYILNNYGIEIPPTYISEIVKNISGYQTDFVLAKDTLHINKLPEILTGQIRSHQQVVDNDTKIIFEGFNQHLIFNNFEKITYKEFRDTFMVYCNLIINMKVTHSKLSRIMSDWIIGVYRNNINQEIILALNKMVYSWLLYTYFYSVKRQNKLLSNFEIVFDTNILTNLLEINGIERKIFIEYLLSKIKQNNCKVVIHNYTIKELIDLLKSDKTISITIFKNNNVDIYKQLIYNTEEYLKTLFLKYNIIVVFNNNQSPIDRSSLEYKNISLDLFNHKRSKRPLITDEAIYHDIMLIHAFGNLKRIINIYSDKKLIATCDNILYMWLGKYLKNCYGSEYSYLLSLEKINLIFWIESDKAESSSFLGNAWMYITETLGYFNNKKAEEYFREIRRKYNETTIVTQNWRSIYLLIDDAIDDNKKIEELTDDEIEKALDSIDRNVIKENEELKTENEKLIYEMKQIRLKLDEVKNSINESNTKMVVNVNTLPQNQTENLSIIILIKMLIKKIWRLFCH